MTSASASTATAGTHSLPRTACTPPNSPASQPATPCGCSSPITLSTVKLITCGMTTFMNVTISPEIMLAANSRRQPLKK